MIRLCSLAAAAALFVSIASPAANAAQFDCGQPVSKGASPTASDALATLKTAVGVLTCDLSVCDVDNSKAITAGDALRILKVAVGQPNVVLNCPAPVTTTTSSTITTITTSTSTTLAPTTTTTTTTLPVAALTWTQIQANFAVTCAGPLCHTDGGDQGGLKDLDNYNKGYNEIIGNEECGSPTYTKRVVAGHPEQSWLMAKLDNTQDCQTSMPFNKPLLDATFRAGVRAWITAGALKN